MDRYVSDDQLDRAVIRLLAERGAEIELSGITPAAAAARIHAKRTAIVPRDLVWAGLLAILAVAMVVATWATVGQRPPPPLVFAPGTIAFVRDGDVYVAAEDGSGESLLHRTEPTIEAIGWIAFGPGARTLAFGGYGDSHPETLYLITPDGGRLSVPLSLGGYVAPTAFDWAPDGQRLVIWSAGYPSFALAIVGVDGQLERTIPLPGFARATVGPETGPLWSPDGQWIAVGGCEVPCDSKFGTHVLLIAADGSGSRWLTQGRSMPDQSMAWSPDSRLAIGRDKWPIVEVLSTDGTILDEVTLPDGLGTVGLAWSPDGTRLAVQGWKGQPAKLVVVVPDGTPAMVSTDPLSEVGTVRWSSDGQRLLFTSPSGPAADLYATSDLWVVDAGGGAPERLLEGIDSYAPYATAYP